MKKSTTWRKPNPQDRKKRRHSINTSTSTSRASRWSISTKWASRPGVIKWKHSVAWSKLPWTNSARRNEAATSTNDLSPNKALSLIIDPLQIISKMQTIKFAHFPRNSSKIKSHHFSNSFGNNFHKLPVLRATSLAGNRAKLPKIATISSPYRIFCRERWTIERAVYMKYSVRKGFAVLLFVGLLFVLLEFVLSCGYGGPGHETKQSHSTRHSSIGYSVRKPLRNHFIVTSFNISVRFVFYNCSQSRRSSFLRTAKKSFTHSSPFWKCLFGSRLIMISIRNMRRFRSPSENIRYFYS